MSMLFRRLLAAVAVFVFPIVALAQGGGDSDKKPDAKAGEKTEKKASGLKFAKPGEAAPKVEKAPDPTLQMPAMQKVKETEDAFRKAREDAVRDLDSAIEKCESVIADAHKKMTGKDKDAREEAHAALKKANEQLSYLRSARYRVTSSQLHFTPPPPQEARLAAKLERPIELVAVQLKLEKGEGLVVASIEKDGAADKAGLKVNDVLVKIDGKAVPSEMKDLRKILAEIRPDMSVTVTVVRAGARETAELKLPATK